MKRKILFGALLLTIITVGSHTQAAAGTGKKSNCDKGCDCRSNEPEKRGEGFLKKMAKELNLTATQQEQIKSIITADREKSAPSREKLHEAGKQLHEAASAEKFDEAAVRAIAVKKAELEIELTVSRAKIRNSINALLTPEQRLKAEKMRPQGKAGRGMMPPPEDMPRFGLQE